MKFERMRVEWVVLWVCDECGYYRVEKSTGVHQASDPRDPNGRMVTHELRAVSYAREDKTP